MENLHYINYLLQTLTQGAKISYLIIFPLAEKVKKNCKKNRKTKNMSKMTNFLAFFCKIHYN